MKEISKRKFLLQSYGISFGIVIIVILATGLIAHPDDFMKTDLVRTITGIPAILFLASFIPPILPILFIVILAIDIKTQNYPEMQQMLEIETLIPLCGSIVSITGLYFALKFRSSKFGMSLAIVSFIIILITGFYIVTTGT